MSKTRKISKGLVILTVGLVLAVAALDYTAPLIDITRYRAEIATRISAALQRQFDFSGNVYLRLSLKPTLVTGKFSIDNPDWCVTDHFLTAEEVELGVDLIDIMRGQVRIDRLILRRASLNLERPDQVRNNWGFGGPATPGDTGEGGGPIKLDYVLLENANIQYLAGTQQRQIDIAHALLKKNLRGRYSLDFAGEFNQQQLRFQLSSNRWLDLNDRRPLDVELNTQLAGDDLSVKIALQQFRPRLRAHVTLNSQRLDVDKLIREVTGNKPDQNNDNKTLADVIDPWMAGVERLSVDGRINDLLYRQRRFRGAHIDAELGQSGSATGKRYASHITLKTGAISDARKKAGLLSRLDITNPERNRLHLTTKGDNINELMMQSRITLHVEDIKGDKPQPYVITYLDANTDDEGRLTIDTDLNYNGKAIRATGKTGKDLWTQLRDQDSLELDMLLSSGDSTLAINSHTRHLTKKGRREIALKVTGQHLNEWRALANKDLPAIESYALDGLLVLQNSGLRFRRVTLQTPHSELKGKLFYRYGNRPVLNILLDKSRLNIPELTRYANGKATAQGQANSVASSNNTVPEKPKDEPVADKMVIPRTDLMKLLAPTMDINLELRKTDVQFSRLSIHSIDLKTRWAEQVFATQISGGKVALGQLTADIYLTVAENEAAGKVELSLRQLDYGKLMEELGLGDKMKGKASIDIHLVGFGRDLKEYLAHSDGTAQLVGEEGVLASRYFRLWGVDIVQEILPLNWFDGDQSKINCVVGRFDLTDGKLSSDSLLLDTEHVTVAGAGAIDLGSEELTFVLAPDPKKLSLISLATPVKIRGTLAKPKIEPHNIATTWTIGSLIAGLANPAILITRFAKLGSLGENPCLAAIGKKEGEQEDPSLLKMFKETVKFIQRPFDKLPDIE